MLVLMQEPALRPVAGAAEAAEARAPRALPPIQAAAGVPEQVHAPRLARREEDPHRQELDPTSRLALHEGPRAMLPRLANSLGCECHHR